MLNSDLKNPFWQENYIQVGYHRRSGRKGCIVPGQEGGTTLPSGNCGRPVAIHIRDDAIRKSESPRSDESRCCVIAGYQNTTGRSGVLQASTVPHRRKATTRRRAEADAAEADPREIQLYQLVGFLKWKSK